jgi:hypothetical protein
MQLTLHDLACRAYQGCFLDHSIMTFTHHFHIDVDLTLGVHHRQQVTPTGSQQA